ncbi:MAG TPA: L,D-transpeptidase family protein [Micromonosporaceae bacterium]|nr:L,D-transpeptidase family protein [Micromonosporaceae bacterium]
MKARIVVVAVVVALVGAGLFVLPEASAATTGPAQVVTVRAAGSTSTYATVEAWSRTSTGVYRRVAGPWTARTGKNGVGPTQEGLGRTPVGSWSFGTAFSVGHTNPGTTLPFFKVDVNDVWAGDVQSPTTYNRHVRCAPYKCPFRVTGHSERLINYPAPYAWAIDLGYNENPIVVGKGSAFFLHVGTGGPTAGCVSLPASQVLSLMKWLRPGAKVTIGIGWRAYVLVPQRYT